jgi:hypothetical protein
MTRNQVQFHIGIGVAGLLPVFRINHAGAVALRILCSCTLALGMVQLALSPIPEEHIQRFKSVSSLPEKDIELELTESAALVQEAFSDVITETSENLDRTATQLVDYASSSTAAAAVSISSSVDYATDQLHSVVDQIDQSANVPLSPSRSKAAQA